ncbi:MAG: class I SAM-dependent methyltransferase [Oligoflexales bacterium]
MKPFDKYAYYNQSVQSPEADVDFLHMAYTKLRGKEPQTLREDFCGTFSVCRTWVQGSTQHHAVGIDLDPEPIAYGKEHEWSQLSDQEKQRLTIHQTNVLNPEIPSADIVCALNFSYFIFKERKLLKSYFQNVYNTLEEGGVFVVDCFGGSQCHEPIEDETEYEDLGFSYYWDQDSFDPITNEAQFYIHFQRDGEAKREQVFSYDWRMWTLPELKDILEEVGFKKSQIFWEGTEDDGSGNGVFEMTDKGEACEAWVAYIAACK